MLFTKRSKSASLPYHQRPLSPNYKTRSTISAPTTTPPGPTERGTGAAPCRHSLTDPRPSPPTTRSRRTTASSTKIDAAGVITVRYNSRLHHIGLSKHPRGTTVTVLIDDLDIRVLDRDTGQLIRKLVLDPTRDYQPRGVKCGKSPRKQALTANDVSRHLSTMSRDITRSGGQDLNLRPLDPQEVAETHSRMRLPGEMQHASRVQTCRSFTITYDVWSQTGRQTDGQFLNLSRYVKGAGWFDHKGHQYLTGL